MATKKRKSPTIKERIKLVKSGKIDKALPGGGATKIVKIVKKVANIAKNLTKGEKVMKRKLKSSIRERIGDVAQGSQKSTSATRKGLRTDLRDLGKIVGEKNAAKFARSKRAEIFKNPKPSKNEPRARIRKNK